MFAMLLQVGSALATGGVSLFLQGALIVYAVVEARKQAKSARRAREASLRDRTVTVRSSNAPARLVYGQTRVPGVLAAPVVTHGEDKRFLSAVLYLASHEVDSITDILFDGKSIGALDANGYVQAGSDYFYTKRQVSAQTITAPAKNGAFELSYSPVKIESVSYETADNITRQLAAGPTGYTFVGRTVTIQTDLAQGRPLTVTYQYSPPMRSAQTFDPYTSSPITLTHTPIVVAAVYYRYFVATDPGYLQPTQVQLVRDTDWTVSGSQITITATLTPSPAAAAQVTVHYDHEQSGVPLVRVKKFLGIAAGERDVDLEAASSGGWTQNHLGKGIARIHVTLQFDEDYFPGGMPEIGAIVKGKKVYDPRTTTTVWSDNPALCIRDYQIDPFGWNMPVGDVNETSVTEAANDCDQSVVYNAASSHSRYRLDGIVYCDGGLRENRSAMLTTIGGWAGMSDGKFVVRTAKGRSPVLSLTDSQMIGGFETQVDVPFRDLFNSVRGQFINPDKGYIADDFPPYPNDDANIYVVADGGRLYQDYDFPFTQNVYRAQRLAKLRLYKARQPLIDLVTYNTSALALQPMDVFGQTRAMLGWVDKPFIVHDWKFDPATMAVTMTVQEDAAIVYGEAYSELVAPDPAPNTTLPNPRKVPNLENVTAWSGADTYRVLSDGSREPFVRITWDAVTASNVLKGGYIEILWKRSINVEFERVKVQASETEYQLAGVAAGDSLNIQVRSVNGLEVRSNGSVFWHLVSSNLPAAGPPQTGGNMVRNAAFSWPMYGWTFIGQNQPLTIQRPPVDDRVSGAFRNVELALDGAYSQGPGVWESDLIPVKEGERLSIFVDLWSENCDVQMYVFAWNQQPGISVLVAGYRSEWVTPGGGSPSDIGSYVRKAIFWDVEARDASFRDRSPGTYNFERPIVETHIGVAIIRSQKNSGAGTLSRAHAMRPSVVRVAQGVTEHPDWAPGDAQQPGFDVRAESAGSTNITTAVGVTYEDALTSMTIVGGGELVVACEAFVLMTSVSAHQSTAGLIFRENTFGLGKDGAVIPASASIGTAQYAFMKFEKSWGVKPVGTHTISINAYSRQATGASAPASLTVLSWTATLRFREPA